MLSRTSLQTGTALEELEKSGLESDAANGIVIFTPLDPFVFFHRLFRPQYQLDVVGKRQPSTHADVATERYSALHAAARTLVSATDADS